MERIEKYMFIFKEKIKHEFILVFLFKIEDAFLFLMNLFAHSEKLFPSAPDGIMYEHRCASTYLLIRDECDRY